MQSGSHVRGAHLQICVERNVYCNPLTIISFPSIAVMIAFGVMAVAG
jgi:hypothetical protein